VQNDDATTAAADWTRFLESLLRALVFAAGAWAWTLYAFLFRPRTFDAAVLDRERTPDERFQLGPLSFLLVNLVLYFYVYPRREQGPTQALIAAAPLPISRALDRIETTLGKPDLPSLIFVVGPLVLLAAVHAWLTTRAFRLAGSPARFETLLAVDAYSAGSLVAALALSAVVGATLTDHAVAGTLVGPGLVAYLVGMVVPFLAIFAWCMVRYVVLARAASGAGALRTGVVVLATTTVLLGAIALLLLANGMRA
jgi:hypothetical protein